MKRFVEEEFESELMAEQLWRKFSTLFQFARGSFA